MSERETSKVTLERLLRLKRAEKPPQEFWATFQSELRQRQLAAAMTKRPWWSPVASVWTGVARLSVPIGASAVLAFTLFSLRDYDPVQPGILTDGLSADRGSGLTSTELLDPAERATLVAAVSAPETRDAVGDVNLAASDRGPIPVVVESKPAVAMTSNGELSPSARSIQANLVAIAETDPVARDIIYGKLSQREPVRTAEPLGEVSLPGDARRERLQALTASLASYRQDNDRISTVRERMASSLTDERLYDSVSRLGVGADRFSISF